MREPYAYSSLDVPGHLKRLLNLDLSFKKRINHDSEMQCLRGKKQVQLILENQIAQTDSLRRALISFRENLGVQENRNDVQGDVQDDVQDDVECEKVDVGFTPNTGKGVPLPPENIKANKNKKDSLVFFVSIGCLIAMVICIWRGWLDEWVIGIVIGSFFLRNRTKK